ncbi:alpha-2-macroglobulin receptor-associated protein-like isoform X1 [Mytilus galloprovincialis]|uniref:alpha-2-macroglobulin receptor-associated protein-like isoform X1 n=1 Tax=Mytilus galloprovincialis TaxID=29158 RepID=UPI003F7B46D5
MNCMLMLFLFTLTVTQISSINKYKEDVQSSPFRMNKINQIWHKASKRLKGHMLADLYADLKIQDGLELQLKRLKSEDMDKGGMKEAEVRIKLRDIVNKYNLQDVIHIPDVTGTNEAFSNDIPPDFKDKKLQKLWEKAGDSGFSDEEMENLKKEFWHQQLKLDEYDLLKDGFKSISDLDMIDNSLDGFNYDKKNKNLKSMNKDIKDGYENLATLGSKKHFEDDELEFKDKRVYELYAMARKSNMTEAELQSFMEELRHFEHRIDKHEYLKEEVQIAENVLGRETKDGEMPQKHVLLKQKANEYGSKVKKYHAELQKKVNKALAGHIEL